MLMDHIPPILPLLSDPQLEIHFAIEALKSEKYCASINPEQIITQGTHLVDCINNPLLGSKLYRTAGVYIYNSGMDLSQAIRFCTKALELSKLCEGTNEQCEVLVGLAMLKHTTGDYCTAQVYAIESQRLSKWSENLYLEAQSIRVAAMCSTALGNFWQSMSQLHRGREILSICGMSGGILDDEMIMQQGGNHRLKSEHAQARSIYNQIMENNSPERNAIPYAMALLNIAISDLETAGDTEHVYQLLNHARDIFLSYKALWGIVYCDATWACMKHREHKFDLAKVKLQECLHSAWGTDDVTESFCLGILANIRAWPTSEWQSRWPTIYCGHAYKLKRKLELHNTLLFLGDVFMADKDGNTATNLYIVALEGFTNMDVHCSRAQCMICLGDLAKEQGHILDAVNFWKLAWPLFEQSSQAKDMAQIDARLSSVEKSHQKVLLELGTLHPPVHVANQEISEITEVESTTHQDSNQGLVSAII
ncbi:hypothetical protein B0H14DRAFT_2568635 [Mycena olivaceomarginata]|nr:hypothetical protein B0H14DRAFT_2568635 [Mycena olivaceomarginata]